jgi:hypothetical protein
LLEVARGVWIGLQQCNNLGSMRFALFPCQRMFPRNFASLGRYISLVAAVAAFTVAAPLPGAAVEFGPPPGAVLSREKLSAIDYFING